MFPYFSPSTPTSAAGSPFPSFTSLSRSLSICPGFTYGPSNATHPASPKAYRRNYGEDRGEHRMIHRIVSLSYILPRQSATLFTSLTCENVQCVRAGRLSRTLCNTHSPFTGTTTFERLCEFFCFCLKSCASQSTAMTLRKYSSVTSATSSLMTVNPRSINITIISRHSYSIES